MRKLGLLILFAIFLLNLQGCKGTSANGVDNTKGSSASQSTGVKLSDASMKLEFKKLDGSKAKLEDYKGKVVLVNIWGTWCGPCRAEIPELIKLKDEYKDKDFEIIGLETAYGGGSDPETEVKSFVESNKINYTIGFAPDELNMEMAKISQRSSVPMTFIFNKKSEIVGIFTGFNPDSSPPKIKKTIDEALNRE
jgi:thiol-disulfide isomerase/thioredoxin